MYLFQLEPPPPECPLSLFTFHYVSISTMIERLSSILCSYLHSTMYLFQRRWFWNWFRLNIYLHSTMYLFQLFVVGTIVPIGFNLHSTMYLFQLSADIQFSVLISIYIPLCIYFNHDPTALQWLLSYHLHSTMYLFQRSGAGIWW